MDTLSEDDPICGLVQDSSLPLTDHRRGKFFPQGCSDLYQDGYSPIDRGSDRPIIEKGPIDRGSFRPRV